MVHRTPQCKNGHHAYYPCGHRPRYSCTHKVQKGDKEVGVVTSGTMSPCLNIGIAMGYVHPDYREKESIVEIIIRDKPVKAKVVRPPIVPKDWATQN